MPWSSKALPWIIPSLLMGTAPKETVVFISPWVENVMLQIGCWEGKTTIEGPTSLSNVLNWLNEERELEFVFYVREDQLKPTMNPRVQAVSSQTSAVARFVGIPDLHAKFLLTDTKILHTSANILVRSLYTNVESVRIEPNPHHNAMKFAQEFFTRHGVI